MADELFHGTTILSVRRGRRVALGGDGQVTLGNVVIKRSSGRKDIDQAALSILRLASPFDPFPADVKKQYEELRFAYEWQFLGAGSQ